MAACKEASRVVLTPSGLTPYQYRICVLMEEGLDCASMAHVLRTTSTAVYVQISRMLVATGFSNRTSLIRWFMSAEQLLDDEDLRLG